MNCREQLDQVPAARGHRLVHWLVGAVLLTGLANATAADPHLTYTVKTGDKVLIGKYAGTEIKLDDQDFLILREDEVLAIVDAK